MAKISVIMGGVVLVLLMYISVLVWVFFWKFRGDLSVDDLTVRGKTRLPSLGQAGRLLEVRDGGEVGVSSVSAGDLAEHTETLAQVQARHSVVQARAEELDSQVSRFKVEVQDLGEMLANRPQFLGTAGGTLSGPLTLTSSAPTDPNHAVSKQYVDAKVGQFGKLTGLVIQSANVDYPVTSVEVLKRAQEEVQLHFPEITINQANFVAAGVHSVNLVSKHPLVQGTNLLPFANNASTAPAGSVVLFDMQYNPIGSAVGFFKLNNGNADMTFSGSVTTTTNNVSGFVMGAWNTTFISSNTSAVPFDNNNERSWN